MDPNGFCYELANHRSNENLLKSGEYITKISGGPFHTVAQSNRGRVFYTGNLYKQSSISNDEFVSSFIELNMKNIGGKVKSAKASMTSMGIVTDEGRLFLMGLFS